MGKRKSVANPGHTFRKYGPHHFGDDIPGALDHHTIAYSDVPIADFILIVEGCPADSTPPTFTGSNSATGVRTPSSPT